MGSWKGIEDGLGLVYPRVMRLETASARFYNRLSTGAAKGLLLMGAEVRAQEILVKESIDTT